MLQIHKTSLGKLLQYPGVQLRYLTLGFSLVYIRVEFASLPIICFKQKYFCIS